MERLSDHFLARPVLPRNENVRVRWADPGDQLQDRLHRRSLCDERGPSFRAEQVIFRLETLFVAEALAQIDLSSHYAQETRVLPWLQDKIASASPHRFHSQLNAPPSGHDDDRH